MVKLFRMNFGGKSKSRKRRLSPNNNNNMTLTPDIIRERFPMYQYALDEFAQTVPPGTSNADGKVFIDVSSANTTTSEEHVLLRPRKGVPAAATAVVAAASSESWTTSNTISEEVTMSQTSGANSLQPKAFVVAPSSVHASRTKTDDLASMTPILNRPESVAAPESQQKQTFPDSYPLQQSGSLQQQQQQQQQNQQQFEQQQLQQKSKDQLVVSTAGSVVTTGSRESGNLPFMQSKVTANPIIGSTVGSGGPLHQFVSDIESTGNQTNQSTLLTQFHPFRSPFENDMPDATYEEIYGEAYTGGRLKYIYPSGYQSMRPRSCPWKLSIVVCLLFTWLSVFIVGHCSDQVEYDADGDPLDDDSLNIRWCGSRPLYLMWVVSMLITGLSASYCSIIGYIKVRDFAVANSRSQPPGVVEGKSDYYVRIVHDAAIPMNRTPTHESATSSMMTSPSYYRPTIYQSDGNPQFWGSHIYRPTQAAVAITNR